MRRHTLLIACALLSACATFTYAEVFWAKEGVYTLRYYTGSHGQNLYDYAFANKARELCVQGYDVLEKSFRPSTLDGMQVETNHYYWVVRCRQS